MTHIKSPFVAPPPGCCDDIYPVDLSKIQRKVVLRAARIRPATPRNLLIEYALDAVLLSLFGGFVYWMQLLGFWSWIRGWFR